MKIYKVIDHIAFDHISDGSMKLSKTVADVIEQNQAKDYNQKFNIQLVQRTTPSNSWIYGGVTY